MGADGDGHHWWLCLQLLTARYDKKARELKQQQTEIGLRIERHQKGDDDYRIALESLISLASRAVELFERSKAEEKRQLVALVFSNLRLNGTSEHFRYWPHSVNSLRCRNLVAIGA